MHPITDPRDIDTDGVWHMNRTTRGCRHCGRREVHYASNGKAAIHHPGVTCCRKAIEDQLRWRQEELTHLRTEAARMQQDVNDLEARAERAFGREATELRDTAARARRSLPVRIERLRRLTDGDEKLEIVGLKHEIADLQKRLSSLDARAA